MTQLPIVQVDAFAADAFTGNPAAVMPLDAWLPDAVLQAIAEENNLSETAFTVPLRDDPEADFELRWFTPTVEAQLCGHATLASGHVLIADVGDGKHIRFRTRRAGVLEVRRDGDAYALSLPAWAPDPVPPPATLAAIGGDVVETLARGDHYMVYLYRDEAAIRALRPDFRALKAAGNMLHIATAPGETAQVVSRVFVPGAGIDEDPVTGSAHSIIVPFWAERLGRDSFTAYQASARGGHLHCTLAGDRVILGGRCRTVIEGMFRL
ncbi:MAG: PhzF family phenazine biosynthesis protein [Sphingobium sp.]|jgi:PhzF family phenazine biosynthesis protein|nr:MAG: PhzF family phenazine biosynthesis protein [Sphingobium sp.]